LIVFLKIFAFIKITNLYVFIFLADNVVELGAQWIHGQFENVVYDLASKHDILDSFAALLDPNKQSFVTINGDIVSKEESNEILTIYFNIMEEAQQELKEEKGSLGDYVERK